MAAARHNNLTSSSLILLLLFLVVPLPRSHSFCLDGFDTRYPFVIFFDEGPESFFLSRRSTSGRPWIGVDEQFLTKTLADTQGFKIISAILEQQHPLNSFITVPVVYKERNGTKLFVPYCDGINIYIRKLQNEVEIVERDPSIIDDIRSGRRFVKRVEKNVGRFDGRGNVTMSHPFVYSGDEFEGVTVHGADGFGSLKFPVAEDQMINKLKIEMVIVMVTNSMPSGFSCDSYRNRGWEEFATRCKRHPNTMLFSLYIPV